MDFQKKERYNVKLTELIKDTVVFKEGKLVILSLELIQKMKD